MSLPPLLIRNSALLFAEPPFPARYVLIWVMVGTAPWNRPSPGPLVKVLRAPLVAKLVPAGLIARDGRHAEKRRQHLARHQAGPTGGNASALRHCGRERRVEIGAADRRKGWIAVPARIDGGCRRSRQNWLIDWPAAARGNDR